MGRHREVKQSAWGHRVKRGEPGFKFRDPYAKGKNGLGGGHSMGRGLL